MEKNKKRIIYEKRIYQVQDYISAHLDEELNLEKLAQISSFSLFHFHRIFKGITGETLYDFIQRIRLEKSCILLSSNPDLKIINIAMDCGFSTPSSFSKAFKNFYNISPSEYRKCNTRNNDNSGKYKSKNGISKSKREEDICTPIEYISDEELETLFNRRKEMNVKIAKLPDYRIAYKRRIGPYGSDNIKVMQELKKWAITRDLFTESSIILSIAHDDPEVTSSENCRYDACIVLSDDYELENSINESKLPGGKYAVLRVDHTVEAIKKAWNDIFSVWLPDSGYQIDNRPVFERYMGISKENKFEPLICEVCIPVKPL